VAESDHRRIRPARAKSPKQQKKLWFLENHKGDGDTVRVGRTSVSRLMSHEEGLASPYSNPWRSGGLVSDIFEPRATNSDQSYYNKETEIAPSTRKCSPMLQQGSQNGTFRASIEPCFGRCISNSEIRLTFIVGSNVRLVLTTITRAMILG
jgi:hypothetical protein